MKLSELKLPVLTDIVLKRFRRNDIHTLVDFIRADIDHLRRMSQLSFREMLTLRRYVRKNYKAPSVSGVNYFNNLKICPFVATGIPKLDAALEGGLPIGKVIQICGLPGSGKTQLAITILSNIIRMMECNCLYIDTKNNCSGIRVEQMLKQNGHKIPVLAVTLERFRVIRIWNMNDLMYLFDLFRKNPQKTKEVRVIVLDSLPCLMIQYHGVKSWDHITLLNQFVNIMRYLSNECKITFIIINILTRWTEYRVNGAKGKSGRIETRTPALGKYWKHVPSLHLTLELKLAQPYKIIKTEIRKVYDDNSRKVVYLNLNSKGVC